MTTMSKIMAQIVNEDRGSVWAKAVAQYAIDILATYADNNDIGEDEPIELTEKKLLLGATDWLQYAEGGYALIYDADICNRCCTASEKKRTKGGERNPNNRETWMDVQARALFQAMEMIKKFI